MSGAKGVVGAFVPVRETTDTVFLAIPFECFFPSGDNLVGIGLVPYVEDQFVGRSVEDIVHAHDKFHSPEARSQVPWIVGAATYYVIPYLVAKTWQLGKVQLPQVLRSVYFVQNLVHPQKLGGTKVRFYFNNS